jgi:2'-5' RNA ligase
MFVALDLPEIVREGISAWSEAELADPALRRVPPESLHVTLAFLGNRPLSDARPIAKVIEWAAEHQVPMELGDPVGRPVRGKPRLIALPVLGGSAEQLEDILVRILAFEGFYRPEKRPFWPHVTVARVRVEGHGSRRPMRVERSPGSLPAELRKPHFSGRLTLYRSELQPSGARYVPLAQVKLPGAGQQLGD